jgi:hypothetical protein
MFHAVGNFRRTAILIILRPHSSFFTNSIVLSFLRSIYRASARKPAATRAPAAPIRSPAALEDWEDEPEAVALLAAEESAAEADEAAEPMALVALAIALEEPPIEAQISLVMERTSVSTLLVICFQVVEICNWTY